MFDQDSRLRIETTLLNLVPITSVTARTVIMRFNLRTSDR